MPELPEVETVRRGLEPVLVGRRVTDIDQHRPDLRFPLPDKFAARLARSKVARLDRRAKIPARGPVRRTSTAHASRHDRAFHRSTARETSREELSDNAGAKRVRTTTSFCTCIRRHRHLQRSAPVRLHDDHATDAARRTSPSSPPRHRAAQQSAAAEYLASQARGKKASLKSFLVDQRVIAGLGNIYACEALYRAGLSPKRGAATIASKTGKPNERALSSGAGDPRGAR